MVIEKRQEIDIRGFMIVRTRWDYANYRTSPSRLRDCLFESNDTVSEVLSSFLEDNPSKVKLPSADDVLEGVLLAKTNGVFVGDFFGAVLLRHYLDISALPLKITHHDPKVANVRKYLHANIASLFRPEMKTLVSSNDRVV